VVDTGLEPVTSAMSMQRSKPTELIDPNSLLLPKQPSFIHDWLQGENETYNRCRFKRLQIYDRW
jgi:hypothetical protein